MVDATIQISEPTISNFECSYKMTDRERTMLPDIAAILCRPPTNEDASPSELALKERQLIQLEEELRKFSTEFLVALLAAVNGEPVPALAA